MEISYNKLEKEKQMKSKKIITILLSLAIMVTFMPMMAFAATESHVYTGVTWASDFHSVTVGIKDTYSSGIVKTDTVEFQYLDPKGVAATKAEYNKYMNSYQYGEEEGRKLFVAFDGYDQNGASKFNLFYGIVKEVSQAYGAQKAYLEEAGAEYFWDADIYAANGSYLFDVYTPDKPALAGELSKTAFDASTTQIYVNNRYTDKFGRYTVDAGDYSAWFATKDKVRPANENPVKVVAVNGWYVNTDAEDFWTVTYPAYDAYEYDTVNGKAANRPLQATVTLNEAAIKAYYGSTALVGTAAGTVDFVANVGTPDNDYFTDWYLEDNDTYNKDYPTTYDNTITYDAKSHGVVFYHMPKNVSVKYYVQKDDGKGYKAPKDADWVDTFPGIKDSGTYYVNIKFIAEKSKVEYVLPGDYDGSSYYLPYSKVVVKPFTVEVVAKQGQFNSEYGKLSKTELEAALAALFDVKDTPDSQDKVKEAFQKYLVLEGVFEDAGYGYVYAGVNAKKLSDDTELAKALSNYVFGTDSIELKVEKAENDITIKTSAKTVKGVNKAKKLKKTKSFKIAYENEFGKVKFTKVSGNSKITVSTAGKVTVKKGLKKGTYKLKVKAYVKGTANYKKAVETKTINVTVK
jgi:hypothetical protein